VNDLIVPVPEDAVMLTLRCEQPGLTGPPGSTLLLEALAVLPEPSARALMERARRGPVESWRDIERAAGNPSKEPSR
ncbi:MAG: hypothetical protein SFY95_06285, partial [Planctomycetota bacterium]|nr:hypothetical protein [Planctomycetota bacterium]